MEQKSIVFNGIDALTGEYLLSLTPEEIIALARDEPVDPQHFQELRERDQRAKEAVFAPMPGVNTNDLAEAGWGIVFPADGDPAIESALTELIEHRRAQAAKTKEGRFKIFRGADGYRPGEQPVDFLVCQGAGPGLADPDQVPFYLLLVGEPTQIPFSFQYQLDVQRAVGRIAFDDPADYAHYARTVVAAEQAPPRPRTATFVGVQNPDDPPTTLSATSLVAPLAKAISEKHPGWYDDIKTVIGPEATKARFQQLFGGAETPAFLFTASHGVGLPKDHPRQRSDQGALICQDWPGPKAWYGKGDCPKGFYFAADDVSDDASLLGLIAFHFACYGAGTPSLNDFAHLKLKGPLEIANQPFVAALPRRLLGHPTGGALAVIGHVERAWSYSIAWDEDPYLNAFVAMVQILLDGQTVGAAMDGFNLLYAELSAFLNEEWQQAKYGKKIDELNVSRLWTANNDARGYVIVGDPAVRLSSTERA